MTAASCKSSGLFLVSRAHVLCLLCTCPYLGWWRSSHIQHGFTTPHCPCIVEKECACSGYVESASTSRARCASAQPCLPRRLAASIHRCATRRPRSESYARTCQQITLANLVASPTHTTRPAHRTQPVLRLPWLPSPCEPTDCLAGKSSSIMMHRYFATAFFTACCSVSAQAMENQGRSAPTSGHVGPCSGNRRHQAPRHRCPPTMDCSSSNSLGSRYSPPWSPPCSAPPRGRAAVSE